MQTSVLQFILDNKIVAIDFNKTNAPSPTTTVLQYLRSLPNHKGVKEGCAEGDCGACTIVIAEAIGNELSYKSFDSCLLFLPMLHGKQLITVENLGDSNNLHQIQKSMVEHDASQCGFCTPGVVMSIFSMYKTEKKPNRETIEDYLVGNLCRCTGYRSIIEAADESCAAPTADIFSETETLITQKLESINNNFLSIETETQKYFQPTDLEQFFGLRKKYKNAIIINGATDVALRVTKKRELIAEIIDLSAVKELKEYKIGDNYIEIGSGISIEESRNICKEKFPALSKIFDTFGSKQIRNIATIGGNIASASPIGDSLPVLMALQAVVILSDGSAKHEIPLTDFIVAYRKTKIEHNEIIYAFRIPFSNAIVKSYKISKRNDLDISIVSAGFALLIENELVKSIALYFGGMAATTTRAKNAEAFLLNKTWTEDNILEAAELIKQEFKPISDARATADGRLIMASNLLIKFWTETS